MQTTPHSCIISRDDVRNGLMVTMGNRSASFYPASVLHAKIPLPDEVSSSENDVLIVSIDRRNDGSVIVEFSDGSTANYTVEDLVKLRPDRTIPVDDHLL